MLFFEYFPDRFKALWESWGVELLVLMNFLFHSSLIFFGSSRKYKYRYWVRGLVWLSFLMSSKFATIILGKLTVIPVDGDSRHTHSELLSLMAPFILMQIGSPDGITAFSIEDAELGLRQILNLVIQFFIVIYILVRSWTNSLISYLYLPLFLAGIIKYGETAWALKSALDCSRNTILHFYQNSRFHELKQKVSELREVSEVSDYDRETKLILIAYCRFFQLRPHLENWPPRGPPLENRPPRGPHLENRPPRDLSADRVRSMVERPEEEILRVTEAEHLENRPPRDLSADIDRVLSIDGRSEEEILRVTEAELGFMYDVLYTKARIVYTKAGCILRIISFFSLTGTLYGFITLFQDIFVYHIGVGFIYFVLAASVILEIYQILLLPFSDWVIVMIVRHLNGGVRETFLRRLAPQSKKWRKWSETAQQFNLLDFCWDNRCSGFSQWKILKYFGIDVKLRKLRNTTRVPIDAEVKKLIVKGLKNIDEQRKQRPFDPIGRWTMETEELPMQMFGDSFEMCIVKWHIATDILFNPANPVNPANHVNPATMGPAKKAEEAKKAIITISNYMMFFLARRPRVLGATNAVFWLDIAIEAIKADLKRSRMDKIRNNIDELFQTAAKVSQKGAHLVEGVKDLLAFLERLEDCKKRKKLVLSAWIEMMCYAASKCERKDHCKHLWQGGELITLVWLLLAHNNSEAPHLPTDPPLQTDVQQLTSSTDPCTPGWRR